MGNKVGVFSLKIIEYPMIIGEMVFLLIYLQRVRVKLTSNLALYNSWANLG